MDVITLASRKGGAGKSTLTAQLAAQAQVAGRRVLVIDADPQGSLKLWHARRAGEGLQARHARARPRTRDRVCDDRRLRHGVHRHRADHVGGGAGGDPRRDPGADPGAAGLLRSRCGARDGEDRARAQQAICGRHQRGAGAARRQGHLAGRAVARLFREPGGAGVGRPDQPARRFPVDARSGRERRRDRPAYRGRRRRSRRCGVRSSAALRRSTPRRSSRARRRTKGGATGERAA